MNRRSFFKGLAAVFAAAASYCEAKARPKPIPVYIPSEVEVMDSFGKFTRTPHSIRIDWEHLDPLSGGFEPGVLDRIKASADESARKRILADREIEPIPLLPAEKVAPDHPMARKSRARWWGHQIKFADGRPWAPLKDDLRAAFRAAMNNPVADTGAVQGTSDRV